MFLRGSSRGNLIPARRPDTSSAAVCARRGCFGARKFDKRIIMLKICVTCNTELANPVKLGKVTLIRV